MNTAGLFIHYLTDHAQRQVFLETRRCIEGRLKLEQENQRQVCSNPDAASQVSRASKNFPLRLLPGAVGPVHSASLCGLGDDRGHELPGGRAQPSWVSQDLHPPVQRCQVSTIAGFFWAWCSAGYAGNYPETLFRSPEIWTFSPQFRAPKQQHWALAFIYGVCFGLGKLRTA